MSMQLLLNQHVDNNNQPPTQTTPPPRSEKRLTTEVFVSKQQCQVVHKATNDSGSPSQTTVWRFETTSVPYFRTRAPDMNKLIKLAVSLFIIHSWLISYCYIYYTGA